MKNDEIIYWLEEILERYKQTYSFLIPKQAVAISEAIKIVKEVEKQNH